jgi:hypothetical protein
LPVIRNVPGWIVISPLVEYLVFGVVREKSIILDVNLRFPKNIGVFDRKASKDFHLLKVLLTCKLHLRPCVISVQELNTLDLYKHSLQPVPSSMHQSF